MNVSERLRAAVGAHQTGNLVRAEELYRGILAADPRQFDALHLLGVTHAQRGDFPEAVSLMKQALSIKPGDGEVLYNLGNAFLALARAEEAAECFQTVLADHPAHFDAYNNLGTALQQLDRPEEALRCFDEAIRLRPDYAEAHSNRGNLLLGMGRLEEALASYDRALSFRPDHADALHNRASVLMDLGRWEEALETCNAALAFRPGLLKSHDSRGQAFADPGRPAQTNENQERAPTLRPDDTRLLCDRGNALYALNKYDEALRMFDRSLELRPDDAEAYCNRANVLRKLGRPEEALASCDKALSLSPDTAGIYFNRGTLLEELKRLDEAAADFQRGIGIDPEYDSADWTLYCAKRYACDWRDFDAETSRLLRETGERKIVAMPFIHLATSDTAAAQLECAKVWAEREFPASAAPLWRGEIYDHGRIRVAYVSADFHNHPLAWLMSGLFEHHDRSRFETIAVSFGPSRPSAARTRLEHAFEHFIDVRQKSSREIAALLRELEVDIAIDRKGYTRDSRTGIFALRPAPVQVNYLAYPATMGADYIDYIIADRFVIPEDHRRHYSEQVVYMPDSYQANDSKRAISDRTPERGEVGLPEKGFVFTCFNDNYKITPGMFDIWMRLLREVEGSVLWLLEANDAATRNLRREAERRGVAPERLVFAPFLDNSDHLARLRLGDLFVDTLPFNAHTTGSDALWAGLPVVTCLGDTFAGRVGGGLLSAAGLPELITRTLGDYEALILALARDPGRLSALRARLTETRGRCALFDTARYTRHLESAFEEMWARYRRGEKPKGFSVPA